MTTFHGIVAKDDACYPYLPMDDIPDIRLLCIEEGVLIGASGEEDAGIPAMPALYNPYAQEDSPCARR